MEISDELGVHGRIIRVLGGQQGTEQPGGHPVANMTPSGHEGGECRGVRRVAIKEICGKESSEHLLVRWAAKDTEQTAGSGTAGSAHTI